MNIKNVIIRSLSGIVYIGFIIASLVMGSAWFCVLGALFAIIGIVEFNRLMLKDEPINTAAMSADIFGVICCCTLPLWIYIPGAKGNVILALGIMFLALYLIVRFVISLYDKSPNAVRNLMVSVLGVVYITLGILSAQYLSVLSPMMVLMLFVYIWINDTGAFLVGSLMGKHRLYERLSPKKSWEGFFGGLILVMLVSVILGNTGFTESCLGAFIYYGIGPAETVFILPVVAVVFATFGDLFESMLKRSVGAKDSGKLIPGHGGLLDRIDSMLFVMPAAAMFLFFLLIA